MAEVKAGDGAAEQGIPQRTLLPRRQVRQQDGGPRGVGPRGELDQPGRVQPEQAGQPNFTVRALLPAPPGM